MPRKLKWSDSDKRRLQHMLSAAQDAVAVLSDSDAAALKADMIRSRALVNCFTEIGEAAARVTQPAKRKIREIPWSQIIGMRNIIVHVYWGADLDELVKTVREDLPRLIEQLSNLLKR